MNNNEWYLVGSYKNVTGSMIVGYCIKNAMTGELVNIRRKSIKKFSKTNTLVNGYLDTIRGLMTMRKGHVNQMWVVRSKGYYRIWLNREASGDIIKFID